MTERERRDREISENQHAPFPEIYVDAFKRIRSSITRVTTHVGTRRSIVGEVGKICKFVNLKMAEEAEACKPFPLPFSLYLDDRVMTRAFW